MSLEQNLTGAVAAMNDLTEQVAGFVSEAEAQIAASQAAYAGLAANLKSVVNNQMNFIATVDPDTLNPTNLNGGTFNSIVNAVNAAPCGSYCEVRLLAGKTYQFDASINTMGRNIVLTKAGSGTDPVVEFVAIVSGEFNYIHSFLPRGGGSILFYGCVLRLPTTAPDPALPWSINRAIVMYSPARSVSVSVDRCTVSGGISGQNFGIAMLAVGSSITMGLYGTVLDGPFFAVSASGAKVITRSALTLQNSAAIFQYGTIGTDVLQH